MDGIKIIIRYLSLTGKQISTERSNGPKRQKTTPLSSTPQGITGSHPNKGSSVGEFVGLKVVGALEGLVVFVTGALVGGVVIPVGDCEGTPVGSKVGLVDGATVGHGPHSPYPKRSGRFSTATQSSACWPPS